MTKKIFRSICFVVLAALVISLLLIIALLYEDFAQTQKDQLRLQTGFAAQGVSHEGLEYFEDFEMDDYRITWIDNGGKVLYDSVYEQSVMENHLEREEIQDALATGYGESSRYSSTMMEMSLYSAQRLEDGTVLRMAVVQDTILMLLLDMLQPILAIMAAAALVAFIIAMRLSKEIVRPLNSLDLDDPLSNEGYDELAPLLRRIDSQQRQLKKQADAMERKQDEFDTVTESMNEGLILLNDKGHILSINPFAAGLFATDKSCVGQDIFTVSRRLELQDLVHRALEGEWGERVAVFSGGSYLLDASPVISDGKVLGAAILVFDVTERANSEQMRREFTGNVSHELKTPLHAISGYAELMKNGMVKEADVGKFAGKIYSEAQRMVNLVEDLIRLSHLDEGAGGMDWEATDLYAVCEETVRELERAAEEAGVTVTLSGGCCVVNGIPQLLKLMIHNLCENAVKYNKVGGSVAVDVRDTAAGAVLTVKDTGIGIPQEHHERIFERFYRVDKSHSKEVGGTGLGLSIVKHGAKVHNARVELKSVPGEGTEITVNFKK